MKSHFLKFTHATFHNESASNTRSVSLRASSHGPLFYTTVAAGRYASSCEYYVPWTDVYNRVSWCGFSRGRDTARLYVTMGKSTGYARERTRVCCFKTASYFASTSPFHCRVIQSVECRCMCVTKLRFFEILENRLLSSSTSDLQIVLVPVRVNFVQL